MPKLHLPTHLVEYDMAGSGPNVVLVHGLADTLRIWDDITEVLAHRFTVVRYDQRGHGGSTCPTGSFQLRDLTNDLHLLLEMLDIRDACVVGHSLGGRIALQLALLHPTALRVLVTVDAQSEAPPGPSHIVVAGMRDTLVARGLSGLWDTFESAGELPHRTAVDASFRQQLKIRFLANDAECILACLNAILEMPNLTQRLNEIAVPVLALVGERDTNYLGFAQKYEEIIAHSQRVVVPGVGHCPHVDAPNYVAAAITKFLTDTL